MIHHPEQKPDEIYMGNAQCNVLSSSSWATSRLGENALDSQGKPIIQESWHRSHHRNTKNAPKSIL